MEYILNITDWNVNLYRHNVLIIGNWTYSQVCSIMLVKTTQYKSSGISSANLLRALEIFDLLPAICPELNKCPGSNPVPDISLSLKDPSFLHLIVKQVTIFGQKFDFSKISTNLTRNVEKFFIFWKHLFFDSIHWKTPYFLCALSLKDSFFDAICHRKTPTSEVLGGTCTSLSYVRAPPPPASPPSFKVRGLQMTINLALVWTHTSSRHSNLNFAHHFVIYWLFQNGANKNQH